MSTILNMIVNCVIIIYSHIITYNHIYSHVRSLNNGYSQNNDDK